MHIYALDSYAIKTSKNVYSVKETGNYRKPIKYITQSYDSFIESVAATVFLYKIRGNINTKERIEDRSMDNATNLIKNASLILSVVNKLYYINK